MINSEPRFVSDQLMGKVFIISHLYFFIFIMFSLFPFPFRILVHAPLFSVIISQGSSYKQATRAVEHHGTCGLLILVVITHKPMQEADMRALCDRYSNLS